MHEASCPFPASYRRFEAHKDDVTVVRKALRVTNAADRDDAFYAITEGLRAFERILGREDLEIASRVEGSQEPKT